MLAIKAPVLFSLVCVPLAENAVEVRFEVLGGEGHNHLLALGHLVTRDDADASSLQWTRVQQQHSLSIILTWNHTQLNFL